MQSYRSMLMNKEVKVHCRVLEETGLKGIRYVVEVHCYVVNSDSDIFLAEHSKR